jgi:hypothetical protein
MARIEGAPGSAPSQSRKRHVIENSASPEAAILDHGFLKRLEA